MVLGTDPSRRAPCPAPTQPNPAKRWPSWGGQIFRLQDDGCGANTAVVLEAEIGGAGRDPLSSGVGVWGDGGTAKLVALAEVFAGGQGQCCRPGPPQQCATACASCLSRERAASVACANVDLAGKRGHGREEHCKTSRREAGLVEAGLAWPVRDAACTV
jgi:hypothetical protein